MDRAKMTRSDLVTIWRDATGLPFHPGSTTERGLRAVLNAVADAIDSDTAGWRTTYNLRKILDDPVNNG
jgi:hypothetical protein